VRQSAAEIAYRQQKAPNATAHLILFLLAAKGTKRYSTFDTFFVPPAVMSKTKQGCMLRLLVWLFVGQVRNCFLAVGVQ